MSQPLTGRRADETYAEACEVGLETFYRWMRNGEEDPEGIYGGFRQAMLQAMAQGEKALHKAAMLTHAIHLLARRFPHHYPSERQLLEVSGKEGLPLIPAVENLFTVVLELNPDNQPVEKRPFEIEQMGGANDGKRERWSGPNGQELPFSDP